MKSVTVSSKGQIVLPAELRRRLGLGPGTRLLLREEAGGMHLSVERPVAPRKVDELAGMLKAKPNGRPRRLEDFDPASVLRRR